MAVRPDAQANIAEPHETAQLAQKLKAQAQEMMNHLSAITQRITEIESTPNNPSAASPPTQELNTASNGKRRFQKMTAVLDQERCMNCGLCVDLCPEQAISMSPNYTVVLDSRRCTGCCSCINECPNEAISLAEPARRAAS